LKAHLFSLGSRPRQFRLHGIDLSSELIGALLGISDGLAAPPSAHVG
jgi:hypothetical protein